MWGQRLLVVLLVPYVGWLMFAYEYHLVDGANLLFHEAGHMFMPPGLVGETMHFLGGTLGQFVFPTACAIYFWRSERRFEAAVCGIWFGESMMYMADYLGDAQAMVLPLVGGGTHDWNWLLTRFGVLPHCRAIEDFFHVLASVLALIGLLIAARESLRSEAREPAYF